MCVLELVVGFGGGWVSGFFAAPVCVLELGLEPWKGGIGARVSSWRGGGKGEGEGEGEGGRGGRKGVGGCKKGWRGGGGGGDDEDYDDDDADEGMKCTLKSPG